MIEDLPAQSPRFVRADYETRMRCECCLLPTIVLEDGRDAELDWSLVSLNCVLCGWENTPADEAGRAIPTDESSIERNDGLSLQAAQLHFAVHGWMYDPACPPPWLVAAPSDDERALRSRLHEMLLVADASSGDSHYTAWQQVMDIEAMIRDLESKREARAEHGDDP